MGQNALLLAFGDHEGSVLDEHGKEFRNAHSQLRRRIFSAELAVRGEDGSDLVVQNVDDRRGGGVGGEVGTHDVRQSFHGNRVGLLRDLLVVQAIDKRSHIVGAAHLFLQINETHIENDIRRVLFHENEESLNSTLRILLDFGS